MIKKWKRYKNTTQYERNVTSSNLYCVLHNNDQHHRHPYRVPAHYIHKFGSLIKVLKCKLKGSNFIYFNKTYELKKRLLVDLVRIKKSDNETVLLPRHGSNPTTTVLSYSIAWNTRQTGIYVLIIIIW